MTNFMKDMKSGMSEDVKDYIENYVDYKKKEINEELEKLGEEKRQNMKAAKTKAGAAEIFKQDDPRV